MTVTVTATTFEGIPVEARCDSCGAWWTQPAHDPGAASLALLGATHRHPVPLDDRPPPDRPPPDVIGAYFEAGWTVDTAGDWHPPHRKDSPR
jgi:hypothetical protein